MSSVVWSGHGSILYCGDGPDGLANHPIKLGVRAVVCDPPYSCMTNADIQKPKNIKTGHEGRIRRNVGWDAMTDVEYEELMSRLFESCASLTDCWVHVFCTAESIGLLKAIAQSAGLKFHTAHIWHKSNPAPRIRRPMHRIAHECAVVCSIGKPAFYDTNSQTVFKCGFEPGGRRWHETQKPRKLMKHLVEVYTAPGDTVADPFAGSGQTLLACMDTSRKAIGWELSEDQCEIDRVAFTEGIVAARNLAIAKGVLLGHDNLEDESPQISLFPETAHD